MHTYDSARASLSGSGPHPISRQLEYSKATALGRQHPLEVLTAHAKRTDLCQPFQIQLQFVRLPRSGEYPTGLEEHSLVAYDHTHARQRWASDLSVFRQAAGLRIDSLPTKVIAET